MAITMKRSPRISGSFKDWLKDYLQNSSVAGCTYYVTSGIPSKERVFWLIVHVTSVIFIVFMTMKATIAFTSNRTVTTVETDKFPVQEINFPAVAICSINKISRKFAERYAREILEGLESRYNEKNFTIAEIMDMLKYLGHLFLFEFDESEREKIELLHNLLKHRFGMYLRIIEKLMPKCESIVRYCTWDGWSTFCEDLFSERKTGDGFCYTFNYGRRNDEFGTKKTGEQNWEAGQVQKPTHIGSRFGLTVILRNNFSDDFYKVLPTMGYKVLISSPLDYPDVYSGGLREIIVPHQTETVLTLQATTLYSHPDVSMYHEDERDCRFADELPGIFEGYYSYSDCLMHCRLLDIIAQCNCIPFFYPSLSTSDNMRLCDLMDLPCLNEYRSNYLDNIHFHGRWWSVRPRLEKLTEPYDEDDSEESKGVLNCTHCLPACTDVIYEVSVSSAPLSPRVVPIQKILVEFEGATIVRIFFKRAGVVKLKQDVLYYWYELMSNYGGICGFFLGISIISIVEFLYFFTLRLFKQPRKSKTQQNTRFTFVKAARPSHRPLYWKEMMQPNFKY